MSGRRCSSKAFAPIPSPLSGKEDLPALARRVRCAVQRRGSAADEVCARQESRQPVAIGGAVEVTKRSKPLVYSRRT